MKKVIVALGILISFASCEQAKIAYVDNSALINDTDERKDIDEKFKALGEANQKRNDSLGKVYEIEMIPIQSKFGRMSQQQLQQNKEFMDFQKKWQLIDQQLKGYQTTIENNYRSDLDSLIVKVKDYVKDYGKTKGYTYILGTSEGAASVMYGKEENDLTQTIIDELNKAYEEKE